MSSTTIVSSIVSAPLGALLKPHGFKKKGLVFRRTVDRLPQVISCQIRQGKTAREATFVLNLGTLVPDVEKLLGGRSYAEPKEYECTVRTRVGAAGRGTRWWTIATSLPGGFDRRIAAVVAWLDATRDPATLQTMLESGEAWAQERLVPTALALVRGERALAQRLFTACVRSVHATRAERAKDFPRDPFGLDLLKDAAKLAKKHALVLPA